MNHHYLPEQAISCSKPSVTIFTIIIITMILLFQFFFLTVAFDSSSYRILEELDIGNECSRHSCTHSSFLQLYSPSALLGVAGYCNDGARTSYIYSSFLQLFLEYLDTDNECSRHSYTYSSFLQLYRPSWSSWITMNLPEPPTYR